MRIVLSLLLAALLTAPSLALAEADVRVNINVGVPLPPPPPLPRAPRVFFNAPPLFLSPPSLGLYIGVDMPYDLVLISGSYYLFQDNNWYRARHYNGPWVLTRYEQLPPKIRKHKLEKIRYHRDHEYRSYHDNRPQYRGKHYRPGKPEKDGKEYRKERQHLEKEERRRDKGRHGRDDD